MSPFGGALVLLVFFFFYSVPIFLLATFFFFYFLRDKGYMKSAPAALLAAPICAAISVYLLAFVLQLTFGIIKDYP